MKFLDAAGNTVEIDILRLYYGENYSAMVGIYGIQNLTPYLVEQVKYLQQPVPYKKIALLILNIQSHAQASIRDQIQFENEGPGSVISDSNYSAYLRLLDALALPADDKRRVKEPRDHILHLIKALDLKITDKLALKSGDYKITLELSSDDDQDDEFDFHQESYEISRHAKRIVRRLIHFE